MVNRPKMSREDRAKQFMPFDALKGLQEALREKEIEYEQRKELTELIQFQKMVSLQKMVVL